ESERDKLLFWLANFDEMLLTDADVQQRLRAPIEDVRRKARQISASNVTDCIRALLVAPALSEDEGLRDAFGSLDEILASATADRRSLGLPFFSDPLLSIIERLDPIRAVSGTA